MILTIRRGPSTDEGTFSIATLDDGTVYNWLELPWRDNKPGASAIPIGTYKAFPVVSAHFATKVYQLQMVPGRTFIEIHPGNWAGDTALGYYSDLLGCMAPGTGVGLLQPPEASYKPQKALTGSRAAFADFMARTKCEPITVTVIGFDDPNRI